MPQYMLTLTFLQELALQEEHTHHHHSHLQGPDSSDTESHSERDRCDISPCKHCAQYQAAIPQVMITQEDWLMAQDMSFLYPQKKALADLRTMHASRASPILQPGHHCREELCLHDLLVFALHCLSMCYARSQARN